MKVGDRVTYTDDDSLVGTIVRVDPNGWVVVQWDEWYGHGDEVQQYDGSGSPDAES